MARDAGEWRGGAILHRRRVGRVKKYDAWVRTVPYTLRNPLYHWSHLELLRYFDIDELINEESAAAIWKQANARLAEPDFTTHGILEKNRVAVIVHDG